MNQNTRQRIIGTVVLAIVAIILLPAIFDGESSYQSSLQTNMPDRPERPIATRELPQRPTIQADSDAIQVREPIADSSVSVLETDNTAEADASQPASDHSTPSTVQSDAATSASQTAATEPQSEPSPVDDDSAPDEAATPGNTVTEINNATDSDVPGLDVNGLPEAWSVRVGAFGNATNASNLTQRLTDGGHRAYTRPVSSSGRELTAVFVGPLISRQDAQRVLDQVKNDYDLNGMIVRYEIEGP